MDNTQAQKTRRLARQLGTFDRLTFTVGRQAEASVVSVVIRGKRRDRLLPGNFDVKTSDTVARGGKLDD